MGLVIPWSCTLAMFNIYSAFFRGSLRLPGLTVIVAIGDMVRIFIIVQYCNRLQVLVLHRSVIDHLLCQVLSILSLAAASASVGVIDLLLHLNGTYCPPKFCGRYQLSTVMAFLAWLLTAASSLFNLRLVASG